MSASVSPLRLPQPRQAGAGRGCPLSPAESCRSTRTRARTPGPRGGRCPDGLGLPAVPHADFQLQTWPRLWESWEFRGAWENHSLLQATRGVPVGIPETASQRPGPRTGGRRGARPAPARAVSSLSVAICRAGPGPQLASRWTRPLRAFNPGLSANPALLALQPGLGVAVGGHLLWGLSRPRHWAPEHRSGCPRLAGGPAGAQAGGRRGRAQTVSSPSRAGGSRAGRVAVPLSGAPSLGLTWPPPARR